MHKMCYIFGKLLNSSIINIIEMEIEQLQIGLIPANAKI